MAVAAAACALVSREATLGWSRGAERPFGFLARTMNHNRVAFARACRVAKALADYDPSFSTSETVTPGTTLTQP